MKPKPFLGVYLSSKKEEQSILPCKENLFIRIAGVIDNAPAEKAGLQEGDIILSLNHSPTCSDEEHILESFKTMIEQQEIGAPVTLDILRNGQQLSLSATLEEMPHHNQREAAHPEIEECPGQISLFEETLGTHNSLPAFSTILDKLYEKSNIIHNPPLADDERSHPLQLGEVTYCMRHPLATGEVAKELSRRLIAPLREDNWNAESLMQRSANLLDIKMSASPRTPEVSFTALLQVMEDTRKRIEEALSNLTPEEKTLLFEKALSPWDDSQWNTIVAVSMKFDRSRLFNAFSSLLSFLTRDNLSLLKEDLIKRFGHNKGPILYEAMTPIGKVIVGGQKPKVYAEDAAVILDLGGDNLYLNNAGGTRPGMPLALVINWGGGNRYISKENFSQGAGVLGGGVLIDLGGNATFISLDGSQGAGFWGIGLLYHGDGTGVYHARRFSQGVGQMGMGLIVNRRGDGRYLCSYGGQGLGLFGGAGILIDEAGNDYYQLGGLDPDFRDPLKSTQSIGQGFGLGVRPEKGRLGVPGGIGMLIDAGGNDTYIADYFAQGASYYYGLGILDDMAGDDQYFAGRYAQGAGIHSSIGVLIDRGGDDFYYSSYGVSQGMGHDFGVGFLEDNRGNDYYRGGTLVQGAATSGSVGVLMDVHGNNRYTSVSKGYGHAEGHGSIGILVDKGCNTDAPCIEIGLQEE